MKRAILPVSAKSATRMARSAGVVCIVGFGGGMIASLTANLGAIAFLGSLTGVLFPGVVLVVGAGKIEPRGLGWYRPVMMALGFAAILAGGFAWLATGSWGALAWVFYAITLLPMQRWRKKSNGYVFDRASIVLMAVAGASLLGALLLAR